MPSVKYVIELTETAKKELRDIITKGQAPARTILRANVLLASEHNSENYMTVAKTAEEAIPEKLKASAANAEAFIEKAKRFTAIDGLTPELVRLFIQRIEIGEGQLVSL